ncbi:sulfurtransferase [Nocardia higoensis]|uniref:sulfurtransferase n=1 Tax=Nocardia higoensis TaxID=228599 RepID=UPI0002DFAB38|nr:rhodanese-like domain-containing protein [Nocardia higoensis]
MSSPTSVISAAELAAAPTAGTHVVVLEILRDRATIPAPLAVGLGERPAGHLPGAHVVDFAEFLGPRTGTSGDAPLPELSQVRDLVERTGIRDDSLIVVYSHDLASSATRAWWVLRWAGLADVRYLDGGAHAWLAAGGELTQSRPPAGGGAAELRLGALPTLDAGTAAALARNGHLLDSRGADWYAGSVPDAIGGHIPGAHSLPGDEDPRAGHFADKAALRSRYAPYLDGAPIGAYCGGGVAATLDVLALSTLGVAAALYPGSWSQWITDPARPIATGAARG